MRLCHVIKYIIFVAISIAFVSCGTARKSVRSERAEEKSVRSDGTKEKSVVVDSSAIVLAMVDRMTIQESAEFYRNNSARYPFLSEYYNENIISGIDEQPYQYVKYIYGLFEQTDLSGELRELYWAMRDSLLAQADSQLEEYFMIENNVLADIDTYVSLCASKYAMDGVTTVSDELMDEYFSDFLSNISEHIQSLTPKLDDSKTIAKILKKGASIKDRALNWVIEKSDVIYEKIDQMEEKIRPTTDENFLAVYGIGSEDKAEQKFVALADTLFSRYLSTDAIVDTVMVCIDEFCALSAERRLDILSSILEVSEAPDSVLFQGFVPPAPPTWENIGEDYLRGVARIKSRSNKYDATSFVASFAANLIPPPFNTVYDAVDLAAGIYLSQKAGILAQEDLEQYCTLLSDSQMSRFINYASILIESLSSEVKESQKKLYNYVHEAL